MKSFWSMMLLNRLDIKVRLWWWISYIKFSLMDRIVLRGADFHLVHFQVCFVFSFVNMLAFNSPEFPQPWYHRLDFPHINFYWSNLSSWVHFFYWWSRDLKWSLKIQGRRLSISPSRISPYTFAINNFSWNYEI